LLIPQELAQLADGRPLLLAGLFLPVLGWVAFNIAGPAFRQLNGMLGNDAPAGKKKRAVTAALTGLSAAALMAAPEHADAAQVRACPPDCPATPKLSPRPLADATGAGAAG
jgi:hypothetical protein